MSPSHQGLSSTQLESFHRDGYLVLPSILTPATVTTLLDETRRMLDSFSLDDHPLTRFVTTEDDRSAHVGDDYFLTSGDKIRFFFEPDAFASGTNELRKPKALAVNKIGHYLHELSPPFKALLTDPETHSGTGDDAVPVTPAGIARSLGFRDPRCLQSMVICKQPEIGGAVPPHQDSTFLYTEPPSAVGFWYALEDATLENGCLSFLPGSHKWAPVSNRLVRKPGNTGTHMITNEGSVFPPGSTYNRELRNGAAPETEYVPGEVKAGSLVLIHGNLLHKSEKNLSQKGRIIYTFHIIEDDGATYDESNWLQPPEGGFTKLHNEAGLITH